MDYGPARFARYAACARRLTRPDARRQITRKSAARYPAIPRQDITGRTTGLWFRKRLTLHELTASIPLRSTHTISCRMAVR